MHRIFRIALTGALVIGAAACGDDNEPVAAGPQRIISLSPTHTEVLFALGADDAVIAIDEQSNFPAAALDKQHDLSGFEPNVEAIAALKPDLVIIADDSKDLTGQLAKLGIEVWVGLPPQSFDDAYAQIEQLGAATGRIAQAAELVLQMQTDIAATVAGVTAPADSLSYYHELDPTFYSVTSTTFIGQVYGLFGLVNIADGVQEGNDYPQLSAEYIVSTSPDLVFLADTKCCGESADTVAGRPGWDAITAVAEGRVAVIDDDIASRWGPRLVDFVKAVAVAIAAVPVGG